MRGLNWMGSGVFKAMKTAQEVGTYSDVSFTDREGQSWPAHQCVLDVASPFLRQIFRSTAIKRADPAKVTN